MKAVVATLTLLGAALIATTAAGVEPNEMLADPVMETRARDISRNLRCLVCQNQSIDDSNASLARDLRVIVRERLVAGDSDTAVIDYVVARYGDFVLLRPPFKASTYALWLGPGVILLLGLIWAGAYMRRQPRETAEAIPLDDAERQRLKSLLDDG